MTTADMEMTNSQEKNIEYCLIMLVKIRFHGKTYRFRKVVIENHGRYITISVIIDNNKPGTFGYDNPSRNIISIGKRGGIFILKKTKRSDAKMSYRKITGYKAVIHSEV